MSPRLPLQAFSKRSTKQRSKEDRCTWVDCTVSLDTTNNIICGSVTSFSWFAIFEEDSEGPVTSNVTAVPNPVALGVNFAVTANVDDSTRGGSTISSAGVNANGGPLTSMNSSDGAFDEVSEDVSLAVQGFTATGVYTLCVQGTDIAGNSGAPECILLPVYDPSGGFVTGGGWINSPRGAYVGTDLEGKANFGFVSKYQKGQSIPSGDTEFKFQVASLNFKSTAYEWLVIAGARAQYKGSGTINGGGSYGFLLTAIDGQVNGGGGVDKFRIKIWDKNNGDTIVYDNQEGSADNADLTTPGTLLGGGSIVIHK